MDRNKLYSLLLDAMEEYGAEDIVGVLNSVLEDLEVKAEKQKQKQKYEDAIELYRQTLLYGTTYYPDLMPENKMEEFMRIAEKDPKEIVEMFSKCFISLNEPELSPVKESKPTPAPVDKSTIKVKTNINGKEDNFEIDADQWFNTLTDFFEKYDI